MLVIWAEVIAFAIAIVLVLLWDLRRLELEIFVATVLAVIVEPAVQVLVKIRVPRPVAVVVTVLVAIAIFGLSLFALATPIYAAGAKLVSQLPQLIGHLKAHKNQLDAELIRLGLARYLNVSVTQFATVAQKAIEPVVTAAKGVFGFVVQLAITATLAFFIAFEGPVLIESLLSLVSESRRTKLRQTLALSATALRGFLIGNLLTSIVAGFVIYLAFSILGLPFGILVAVWVGLVDLIPLVGGLLASVPVIGIALFQGIQPAIIMLVVFVVYQEIENHLLNPLVMSRTVRLNPLWILLAVLVGAQLGSLLGAIVAIPAASVLQIGWKVLARDRFREYLAKR